MTSRPACRVSHWRGVYLFVFGWFVLVVSCSRVHPALLVNVADWAVLLGTMVGIAAYGSWRTRDIRSLNTYLKGSQSTGWGTIGLSVMATQASAITFCRSRQGFESGIGFVRTISVAAGAHHRVCRVSPHVPAVRCVYRLRVFGPAL
jgi:hypothetical protein